jgi:hypothetical protein
MDKAKTDHTYLMEQNKLARNIGEITRKSEVSWAYKLLKKKSQFLTSHF